MSGKLILLPNVLDPSCDGTYWFPPAVGSIVGALHGLIAESEKEARKFLLRFFSRDEMVKRSLALLNEHTSPEELNACLLPMARGETWGLISDAGLPCIADPGANLVHLARQKGISVESMGGTSAVFLALQLSGFSGQRFTFHGYLSRDIGLEAQLKALQLQCRKMTQIWIEAPYRTDKMVEMASQVLCSDTLFCVAAQLTTSEQQVFSMPIATWRKKKIAFGKVPAIFLMGFS